MNRLLSLAMMALLTIGASAQTTDRLSASSVLHYNQKGIETDKDLIEIFRYEAHLEGKRQLSDYPINHEKLIIVKTPVDPPFALTYDAEDTTLVVLKSSDEKPMWDKTRIAVAKMKVDASAYDSIQMLHMLAVYTAVPMDQRPISQIVDIVAPRKDPKALFTPLSIADLGHVRCHFVWGDPTGDKYARTHNCESETARILQRTFIRICWAVYNNKPDHLDMLDDTIRLLLTQYRTLLLPDVHVDGVLLDKNQRK